MITLLKSEDLHEHLHENTEAPEEEQDDEAKAAFLIKKNVCLLYTSDAADD